MTTKKPKTYPDLFGGETELIPEPKANGQAALPTVLIEINFRKSTSISKCGNCLHFREKRIGARSIYKCHRIVESDHRILTVKKGGICDYYKDNELKLFGGFTDGDH